MEEGLPQQLLSADDGEDSNHLPSLVAPGKKRTRTKTDGLSFPAFVDCALEMSSRTRNSHLHKYFQTHLIPAVVQACHDMDWATLALGPEPSAAQLSTFLGRLIALVQKTRAEGAKEDAADPQEPEGEEEDAAEPQEQEEDMGEQLAQLLLRCQAPSHRLLAPSTLEDQLDAFCTIDKLSEVGKRLVQGALAAANDRGESDAKRPRAHSLYRLVTDTGMHKLRHLQPESGDFQWIRNKQSAIADHMAQKPDTLRAWQELPACVQPRLISSSHPQ